MASHYYGGGVALYKFMKLVLKNEFELKANDPPDILRQNSVTAILLELYIETTGSLYLKTTLKDFISSAILGRKLNFELDPRHVEPFSLEHARKGFLNLTTQVVNRLFCQEFFNTLPFELRKVIYCIADLSDERAAKRKAYLLGIFTSM
jgi:hypothetical protein